MSIKLIIFTLGITLGFLHLTAQDQLPFDPDKIDIVRDSFGVAHIFAKTDAEVAYGLEWATLEDDAENAQFMLYALKGFLGRSLGVEGAGIDFAVKMMGVADLVEEKYETDISDEFKRVLEGAAAGINAWAKAHPDEVKIKKAFPVTPQDIVVGYMLGLGLMAGIDGTLKKIVNGGIVKDLPEDRDPGIGSNGFAFGPAKTKDGSTMLAVNSHQPLEGLLSWYEAHVCSEEGWNISGAMFHGATTIFVGSNEHLGWGHTTGDVDTKDVFVLEMHPKKKNWYKYDDQWLKLETHKAKLKVALGKNKGFVLPITKKYWRSMYGPTLRTKHGTYAVRMPAMMTIKAPEQWYKMNKSTNFEEFKNALNIQGLAHQNITYADKEGNIMQLANGLMPKRAPGFPWKKVVPGNTSKTLWKEYFPVSKLAQFENPECGYVFNVNNSAFDGASPSDMLEYKAYDRNMGYRIIKSNNRSERFHALMEKYDKIDFDDFKKIKFDNEYPDSMQFMRAFDINLIFEIDPVVYPDIKDALLKIRNWDRVADTADTDFAVLLYALYYIHENSGGKQEKLLCESVEECLKLYVTAVRHAQKTMIEHFGTIDVPLSRVQVHQRGDKVLPIAGGPDAIRAVYSKPWKDGMLRMNGGDGFVQLVNFTKDGTIIENINAYGASNKPDSPHYNDQMEMFVAQKFRRIYLDKEEVYKRAERIYHPK